MRNRPGTAPQPGLPGPMQIRAPGGDVLEFFADGWTRRVAPAETDAGTTDTGTTDARPTDAGTIGSRGPDETLLQAGTGLSARQVLQGGTVLQVGQVGTALLVSSPAAGRALWVPDPPLPPTLVERLTALVPRHGLQALVLGSAHRTGRTARPDGDLLPAVRYAHPVAELRRHGLLAPDCALVLAHPGEPNDLASLAAGRIRAWGFTPLAPGQQVSAAPGTGETHVTRGRSAAQGTPASGSGTSPAAPTRTLVLGGSGSGKSQVAEDLLATCPAVRYLATGPAATALDTEWAARVAAHRSRRPPWWSTEETGDLVTALGSGDARTPVLVDALGTWLAGALDRLGAWDDAPGRSPATSGGQAPDHWRDRISREVDAVVDAWCAAEMPVVAVSDEVGWGLVATSSGARAFQDLLARLNRRIAAASDRVLLVAAGRVLDLSACTW